MISYWLMGVSLEAENHLGILRRSNFYFVIVASESYLRVKTCMQRLPAITVSGPAGRPSVSVLWREALPRDEGQAWWPALRAVAAFPHTVLELPGLPDAGRCQGQHFRESSIPQQEPAAVPAARGQVQLGCLQQEAHSLKLLSAFRRSPRLAPWQESVGCSGSRLEVLVSWPGACRLLGLAAPPASPAAPGEEHYESRPPGSLRVQAPLLVVQAAGEAGALSPCHSSHVRRGFARTQGA